MKKGCDYNDHHHEPYWKWIVGISCVANVDHGWSYCLGVSPVTTSVLRYQWVPPWESFTTAFIAQIWTINYRCLYRKQSRLLTHQTKMLTVPTKNGLKQTWLSTPIRLSTKSWAIHQALSHVLYPFNSSAATSPKAASRSRGRERKSGRMRYSGRSGRPQATIGFGKGDCESANNDWQWLLAMIVEIIALIYTQCMF